MSVLRTAGISIAAAHGLTARTIQSWYPALPRDPRVMVPIQADALVVRQAGAQWADTAMKRTPAGADVDPMPAKDLLPKPFALRAAERPRGVYLHWALPEALTRGSQNAPDGAPQTPEASTLFPAVPDRWLVSRISPSATRADRRAMRGWILQAHDDNPVPIDLDNWREPGQPPAGIKNVLTALGYGDLSWAGFFDNTQNRLAFYDDLQDVSSGPLAYLVCGWYSDPALDPLGSAQVHSLADFDARMKQLGWALSSTDLDESKAAAARHVVAAQAVGLPVSALRNNSYINRFENAEIIGGTGGGLRGFDPQSGTYSTDGSWWPQMTVLHGAVVGIGWPGIGWEGNPTGVWNPGVVDREILDTTVVDPVGGPPPASSISVTIGNTITETLAKLVATQTGHTDETRILEAFELNALNVLNEPDGAARVDALLHANSFGSISGGEVTETIWQPPSGSQTPPAVTPQPDPGVFSRYEHFPDKIGGIVGVNSTAGLDLGMTTARTQPAQSPAFLKESQILKGNLTQLIDQTPVQPAPAPQPGKWIDVQRALPRFFHPTDPTILIRGGKASFKHKSGAFSKDGFLYCRLTGDSTTHLSCQEPSFVAATGGRPSVLGADLLERGVENGGVPPECEDLLRELALLDPGTSLAAAHTAAGPNSPAAMVTAVAKNFMVEQTAWHAVRDPRTDPGPLAAHSGIAGRLPSPIAISLPVHPWNPIRLDWSVEYLQSAEQIADWQLDEIDYQLRKFDAAAPVTFENSCVLTQAAGNIAADAIRKALEQAASAGGSGITQPGKLIHFFSPASQKLLTALKALRVTPAAAGNNDATGLPSVDRLPLDDIASALSDMDILTGGLDGLNTFLRGGYAGDGVAKPSPTDPAPDPFTQLRSGFLRVTRLRLVDGFGQFIDLLQSPQAGTATAAAIVKSDPMTVPGHDDLVLLPPRFTAPARLWFRYLDSGGSGQEATSDPKGGNTVSPVCGYLMPNHLDGALEFFDAEGLNLGFVRPQDDKTILWEEAPGQPSTVGQNPERAIDNPFSAGIATALIRWGTADAGLPAEKDNALQALLRVIDSTLWSVDPFGHTGDEHLSLLIGHPVVVVRAQLRLELQEPIQTDAANFHVVPVRLGALAQWQDGLFGYFVNDDYTVLHVSDAAAAGLARQVGPNQGFLQPINLVPQHFADFVTDAGTTPVTHPYVDTSGVVWIHPNQDVNLTLLVEPNTVVHATSGLLPRKEIGLRREWVAAALAKLSPTFRFGPLLVDPKAIRMPIPTDINGTWSWDYRADANTWAELPITNATQDAILPVDAPSGTEGWVRLTPPEENPRT